MSKTAAFSCKTFAVGSFVLRSTMLRVTDWRRRADRWTANTAVALRRTEKWGVLFLKWMKLASMFSKSGSTVCYRSVCSAGLLRSNIHGCSACAAAAAADSHKSHGSLTVGLVVSTCRYCRCHLSTSLSTSNRLLSCRRPSWQQNNTYHRYTSISISQSINMIFVRRHRKLIGNVQ